MDLDIFARTFCIVALTFSFSVNAWAKLPDVISDFSKSSRKSFSDPNVMDRVRVWTNQLADLAKSGDVSGIADEVLSDMTKYGLREKFPEDFKKLQAVVSDGRIVGLNNVYNFVNNNPVLVDVPRIRDWLKSIQDYSSKKEFILSSLQNIEAHEPELAKKRKEMCGQDVDLSESFPAPVKDQTDTNWCYAYALADILSYKLKKDISPFYIASNYIRSGGGETKTRAPIGETGLREGGRSLLALLGVKRAGKICLEENLPSEARNHTSGERARFLDLLLEIETFKNASSLFPEIQAPYTKDVYCRVGASLFPNLDFEAFAKILEHSALTSAIGDLAGESCKTNSIPWPEGLELSCRARLNEKSHFSAIVTDLERQRRPVLVNITPDVLIASHRSPGLYRESGHEVVISGKRWNQEKAACEFKIRDSAKLNGSYELWIDAADLLPSIAHGCALN